MALEVINSVPIRHKRRGVYEAVYDGVPIRPGSYQHYDLVAIREQLEQYTLFCNHRVIRQQPAPFTYHDLPYARSVFEGQRSGINPNILLRSTIPLELYDLRRRTASSIVTAQIGVEQEEPESLVPMVASLNESAEELTQDGKVLFIPYFNFVMPGVRNRRKEYVALKDKTRSMSGLITDMTHGSNITVQPLFDITSSQRSWSERRNSMAQTSLQLVDDTYIGIPWQEAHDMPYVQLDADNILGRNTLRVAKDTLAANEAIFVTGTLHYIGGIMEKSSGEVATDTGVTVGQRLLYFTEIMRRRMFDHLSPLRSRGYPPDSLAMKLGVPATLSWYEEADQQNETYFLQIAAFQAWLQQMDVQIKNLYSPYSHNTESLYDPYLSNDIASTAQGVLYYAPHQESKMDASIRGLEGMVGESGPIVLLDFDQGGNYMAYSEQKDAKQTTVREPTKDELLDFINAVYSAFKDRGGDEPREVLHQAIHLETLLTGKVPVEAMNLQELAAVLFPQLRVTFGGVKQSEQGVSSWQFDEYETDAWRTENWPTEKWPKAA